MSQGFEWHPLRLPSDTRPAPLIELLGFPSCPQLARVRASLASALGGIAAFTEVNPDTLPAEDPRRTYPSPTILVNGRDLFGLALPKLPSKDCRLYVGGLPDAQTLIARLRSVVELAPRPAGPAPLAAPPATP